MNPVYPCIRTQEGVVEWSPASFEFDEAKIDQIFSGIAKPGEPGAVVGINFQGETLYSRGFGLADIASGIPLTSGTRLRLSSVTKHLTCFCYLRLCELGKAGLHDKVGEYLPELHESARNATIQALMGHVSGLRDAKDILVQSTGAENALTIEDIVGLYERIGDVNFPCQTSWLYNNGAYAILTRIIEIIAESSFEDAMTSLVFAPLGLSDTMVQRSDAVAIAHRATLYKRRSGSGADSSDEMFLNADVAFETAGEGGVISSASDMLRWLGEFGRPTVGGAASWKLMTTSGQLKNGAKTHYGLGLRVNDHHGLRILHHGGATVGGNCQILHLPDVGLDLIILVNRDDVFSPKLADEVLRACLRHFPRAPARAGSSPSRGVYCSPESGRIMALGDRSAMRWTEGATQIVSLNGVDMPAGPSPSHPGDLEVSLGFYFPPQRISLVGNREHPVAVEFEQFGKVDRFLPVERGDAAANMPNGRYLSPAIACTAEVRLDPDGLKLALGSEFGTTHFILEGIGPGIWKVMPLDRHSPFGGVIRLADDGGKLFLSTLRNMNIEFNKIIMD